MTSEEISKHLQQLLPCRLCGQTIISLGRPFAYIDDEHWQAQCTNYDCFYEHPERGPAEKVVESWNRWVREEAP